MWVCAMYGACTNRLVLKNARFGVLVTYPGAAGRARQAGARLRLRLPSAGR